MTLSVICARARNMYREVTPIIGRSAENGFQQLIDDQVMSLDIDPRIPPIQITSARFDEEVGQHRSLRAEASDMKRAQRYHPEMHLTTLPRASLRTMIPCSIPKTILPGRCLRVDCSTGPSELRNEAG